MVGGGQATEDAAAGLAPAPAPLEDQQAAVGRCGSQRLMQACLQVLLQVMRGHVLRPGIGSGRGGQR